MRTQRTLRGGIKLPLASVLAATVLVPSGCKQVEDIAAKVKGEESKEESKVDSTKDAKDPDKAAGDGAESKPTIQADPKVDPTPIKADEIEALPVEEMHTGLDLMLEFVPNADAEFAISRDATVIADYIEEGMRFVDGPIAKLAKGPGGPSKLVKDLGDWVEAYDEVGKFSEKIGPAIASSGLLPKEGIAWIKDGKAEYVVFNAEDPLAFSKFAEAIEPGAGDEFKSCRAVAQEGDSHEHDGWQVCAKKEGDLAGYKRAADPAPLRTKIESTVAGVDLTKANFIVHVAADGDMVDAVVTTIPGSLHLAVAVPAKNKDFAKLRDALVGGEAKTLANVSPGAGFVWANVNPKVLEDGVKAMGAGAPPPAAAFVKSLTGDFVFAGSVDPAGIVLQAGVSDAKSFDGLLALADMLKGQAPKEIPEFGNAKLAIEKVEIGTGAKANALHVALTEIAEADILKSYTGLHMDAWTFAAGNVFTVAVGPNAEGIGKLVEAGGGGPSEALLAGLPPALGAGLTAKTVSFAMHLPIDFLHGKQLRALATAALKDVPDAKPDELLALASLSGAFSSTSMWIDQPGESMVFHWAVQGIGNRETEEGKVALTAAHAVVDGGDPEAEFGPIAAKFAASPMSYAYKARAGVDGPGYMVGSGVGAVMASALVAVPVAVGLANKSLADDLGVKADDPEPVIIEPEVPQQPKVENVPKQPKPTTAKEDDAEPAKEDDAEPAKKDDAEPAKKDDAEPAKTDDAEPAKEEPKQDAPKHGAKPPKPPKHGAKPPKPSKHGKKDSKKGAKPDRPKPPKPDGGENPRRRRGARRP